MRACCSFTLSSTFISTICPFVADAMPGIILSVPIQDVNAQRNLPVGFNSSGAKLECTRWNLHYRDGGNEHFMERYKMTARIHLSVPLRISSRHQIFRLHHPSYASPRVNVVNIKSAHRTFQRPEPRLYVSMFLHQLHRLTLI